MAPAPLNSTERDTIFALSSGRPPAAIAIVRVSGPGAGEALRRLSGRCPEPRVATLATLRSPEGEALDRALTLWFPGPASATGEDLAELHLHGGIAVVDAVLAALAAIGLRPAQPGEFTRRALFNGRIDLAEAEGLADLLAAETETQRREALRRADGALGRQLRGWADRIVALSAELEAAIDYDGDVEEALLLADLGPLIAAIETALAVPPAERLRDGIRVAIVGPPNAGKSSLFNALVGTAAAIVSPVPGTTRDVIERPVALRGIPIVLIDTAGLRESSDAIEAEGVLRAQAEAETADLLLDLGTGSAPDRHRIVVAAKADLARAEDDRLAVSSLTGFGMDALIDLIVKRATHMLPAPGEVALHRHARTGVTRVIEALRCVPVAPDSILAAEHLRTARRALDELIGGATVDSVLDALFARFCLGK